MVSRIGMGRGFIVLVLLSACSGEQQTSNVTTQSEANPGSGNAAEASTGPDNATAAVRDGLLTRYVGKHPSAPVDGTRFLDESVVRTAVAGIVSDAAVRKFVFGYDGPDAPIVAKAGRILAWGCERHNCGYHNWSISITPDGTNAEVCFYRDDKRPDGESTWYLAGGKTEQRPGNCPSE